MKKYQTFKKDYAELFNAPFSFFGSVALSLNKRFSVKPQLYIESKNGERFTIEASEGKAGFTLRIRSMNNATIVDAHKWKRPEDAPLPDLVGEEVNEIELCIYHKEEWSQAFKKWYLGKGEYPGDKEEFKNG